MRKRILFFLGFLISAWSIRVQAQEPSRLTFSVGGGVSAPLNQNVGVSGNFIPTKLIPVTFGFRYN